MDIYEHFSCYTKLPIRLDDIRSHIIESGRVHEFKIAAVDINRKHLQGMSRLTRKLGNDGKITAEIIYSSELERDVPTRRMVLCKEILHTVEPQDLTANTKEVVTDLINNIVSPLSLSGITATTLSDHLGMLRALMVLLPRDSLFHLRPKHRDSRISVEQIANLARIPDAFARLALSDIWEGLIEKVE